MMASEQHKTGKAKRNEKRAAKRREARAIKSAATTGKSLLSTVTIDSILDVPSQAEDKPSAPVGNTNTAAALQMSDTLTASGKYEKLEVSNKAVLPLSFENLHLFEQGIARASKIEEQIIVAFGEEFQAIDDAKIKSAAAERLAHNNLLEPNQQSFGAPPEKKHCKTAAHSSLPTTVNNWKKEVGCMDFDFCSSTIPEGSNAAATGLFFAGSRQDVGMPRLPRPKKALPLRKAQGPGKFLSSAPAAVPQCAVPAVFFSGVSTSSQTPRPFTSEAEILASPTYKESNLTNFNTSIEAIGDEMESGELSAVVVVAKISVDNKAQEQLFSIYAWVTGDLNVIFRALTSWVILESRQLRFAGENAIKDSAAAPMLDSFTITLNAQCPTEFVAAMLPVFCAELATGTMHHCAKEVWGMNRIDVLLAASTPEKLGNEAATDHILGRQDSSAGKKELLNDLNSTEFMEHITDYKHITTVTSEDNSKSERGIISPDKSSSNNDLLFDGDKTVVSSAETTSEGLEASTIKTAEEQDNPGLSDGQTESERSFSRGASPDTSSSTPPPLDTSSPEVWVEMRAHFDFVDDEELELYDAYCDSVSDTVTRTRNQCPAQNSNLENSYSTSMNRPLLKNWGYSMAKTNKMLIDDGAQDDPVDFEEHFDTEVTAPLTVLIDEPSYPSISDDGDAMDEDEMSFWADEPTYYPVSDDGNAVDEGGMSISVDMCLEMQHTKLGTQSLFDMIVECDIDKEGITNKEKVATAWLALSQNNRELIGIPALPISKNGKAILQSRVLPSAITVGSTSLKMFLDVLEYDDDDRTTDKAIYEAFKFVSNKEAQMMSTTASERIGRLARRLCRT
ncbi:hypothetical protein K505DRAFT_356421 [Melanomma pulvis-pyrius CBS 109.77]|uniref:Uncharacterized protein n=1 Tax=Melanomma pulvis-pyrius CBS 109.77 TaxID=1314802 RepID=A0A6A6XTQ4_9PLEO|nr:hypothetical protein K505DRAFT_356421 [Melanomma pulvis-pyrius CBS 109.77]